MIYLEPKRYSVGSARRSRKLPPEPLTYGPSPHGRLIGPADSVPELGADGHHPHILALTYEEESPGSRAHLIMCYTFIMFW